MIKLLSESIFTGNPLPLIVIKAPPALDIIEGLMDLMVIFWGYDVTLVSILT